MTPETINTLIAILGSAITLMVAGILRLAFLSYYKLKETTDQNSKQIQLLDQRVRWLEGRENFEDRRKHPRNDGSSAQ